MCFVAYSFTGFFHGDLVVCSTLLRELVFGICYSIAFWRRLFFVGNPVCEFLIYAFVTSFLILPVEHLEP